MGKKKHKKLKWKPLPLEKFPSDSFAGVRKEEERETTSSGTRAACTLPDPVQNRTTTGNRKTGSRSYGGHLWHHPRNTLKQIERFKDSTPSHRNAEEISEEQITTKGYDRLANNEEYERQPPPTAAEYCLSSPLFAMPCSATGPGREPFLQPFYRPTNIVHQQHEEDCGNWTDRIGEPPRFLQPDPFLFGPCFAYCGYQNGYTWWLPSSSRGRRSRGRRRPRFGGEGISYDRWPSRKKPSSSSEDIHDDDIRTSLKNKLEMDSKMADVHVTVTHENQLHDNASENINEMTTDDVNTVTSSEGDSKTLHTTDETIRGLQDLFPDEAVVSSTKLLRFTEDLVKGAFEIALDKNSVERANVQEDGVCKQEDDFTEVDLCKNETNVTSDFGTEELSSSGQRDVPQEVKNGDFKMVATSKTDKVAVRHRNASFGYRGDDGDFDDKAIRMPFASRDVSKYYKLCSSDEIVIHELDDDASECGSEDVEMIGHRYETSAATAATERRYKNNQMSLASEIMSARSREEDEQEKQTKEWNAIDNMNLQMPPISVESEEQAGCYTNTHMLEGYYGEMRRPKFDRPVSDVLDSGIHTSDDDEEDVEILFARKTKGIDSATCDQPTTESRGCVAERTPLVYLKTNNPWYYGCCSVM